MEFRQLRYFVAVAEEGNIGRAAEKLHISQPPISRQIQALEYELGAPLFNRTPKGVTLTEAGRTFLQDAQRVLAHASLAVDRTRAAHAGEIGQLDVAFFGSPVYLAVPVALRAFQRALPETEISLTRMGKQEQINALRDGRIHIGFARFYPVEPDITVEKVADERLFAAIPQDLALASGSEVTMADVATLPLVLFPSGDRPSFADAVLAAFAEMAITPPVHSTAVDTTAGLALTASGKRCSIVPESVATLRFPTLRFLPIADCPIRAQIACAYSSERKAPILEHFLNCLHSISLDPGKFATQRDTDSVFEIEKKGI